LKTIWRNHLKKIIFTLLLLTVSLFAELKNEYISPAFIESKIPIVDIRTPAEWKETGLLKNSIPIMFFDERGNYDLNGFLKQLHAKVDTTKPFALICRSGNRTSTIAPYFAKKLGYKVINLKGGITYAIRILKMKTTPYR
jgi:rhodanese-related sulfurtransferase